MGLRNLKQAVLRFLRWSERYTKTDMVYLVTSSFWMQSTSVFVSLASFLLYIVLGHFVSREAYGTYQYLLSLAAIVSAFTLSGMNSAVVRAVVRGYEGTYMQSVRVQLIWNIIPAVGAWALGFYYLLHNNQVLGWGLLLIGVFTPLSTVYNTYSSYLGGKKEFRRGFVYSLYINGLYYISVALVAISVPVALSLLFANIISQTIGYFIAHRRVMALYKPNAKRDPEAMRYGAHLSLMNLLGTIATQVDSVFVFHFLGANDLALYSFATAVPARLNVFKVVAGAAFPKYALKSRFDLKESIWRKLMLGVAAASVVAGIYAIFARPFFELFFPSYIDAVPFSAFYGLTIITAFGSLFTTALIAQGDVRRLYVYNIVSPIVLIGFELAGVVGWGLWGLVVAIVLANLINSLLGLALVLWNNNRSQNHPIQG